MKTPTLLFTADDLGITMARSRGILHAIQHGLVNRTSIMANGHAAAEAVELFRAHGQLHTVGLHLNLTEGAPLSPPLTIRSLLQEQNMTMQQPTFKGKGAYHRGCTEGSIVADDIAAEAKAQIAWFVANVGHPPPHVDGHQHCHVFPTVATVLAKVFAEAGVKGTRIPAEPDATNPLCAVCSKVSMHGAAARKVFADAGIDSTSRMVGLSFCGKRYTAVEMVDAIEAQLKPTGGVGSKSDSSSCEIMVHPGLPAVGKGWDTFDESIDRFRELEILCSIELRELLEERLGVVMLSPKVLPVLASADTITAASEALAVAPDGGTVVECGGQAAAAPVTIQLPAPSVGAHVHLDPDNFLLHSSQALSSAFQQQLQPTTAVAEPGATSRAPGLARVLYVGCGSGVIGLQLLRLRLAGFVHFSDKDPTAVAIAAANAVSNGYVAGVDFSAAVIDLEDDDCGSAAVAAVAVAAMEGGFTAIVCNPPQMPGPPELKASRPDKYGGGDGLWFYAQLAKYAEAAGPSLELVLIMQTSFSSFAGADTLFAEHGFAHARVVKEQSRRLTANGITALAAGCYEWLLELRSRGGANFDDGNSTEDGKTIEYKQRLCVFRRV